MGTVWERISPPVKGDGVRAEWTPSTVGKHYTLVDEGMASPNDADYVYTIVGAKREGWYIPTGLTGTGAIHRLRFGFRYKGSAVPVKPGVEIRLYVGGVQWGSTAQVSVDTDDVWTDGQVVFNFGPGKTVDDWNDAGTRVILIDSAPAVSGFTLPDEYAFQVDL